MNPPAPNPAYRGRFAPSPSGPLHFGSLVAAVGSYLEARAAGGEWRVRIEDVDEPRTVPGADAAILRQLEACGFAWDGEVVWQSRRKALYEAAFDQLRAAGQIFPCACTRREIADSGPGVEGASRYPGTCRKGLPPGRLARAYRLRVDAGEITFEDAVQGKVSQDVTAQVGDFVVRRADGLFAYQLAVVVDDAAQGVSHVVRGADLLDSTPRQILLQRVLGVPTPAYLHLPVAVNAAGEKLSKQTLAQSLDSLRPQQALVAALNFLGQQPPADLLDMDLAALWRWAISHWVRRAMACEIGIPAPAGFA